MATATTDGAVDFAALGAAILVAATAMVAAWPRLRGTTLLAPWCWTWLAWLAVAAVALAERLSIAREPLWLDPARYLAAITTCAPIMGVLGAKRPQAGAWQFIVLTLIGVLALPAVVTLAIHDGESVSVHVARQWFLAVLILVALVNYLPTRYALSALLFVAAQVVLLGEYLPASLAGAVSARATIALALAAGAAVLALLRGSPRSAAPARIDRLWLDFRDAYGVLWAVRIMERVNVSSGGTARDGPLSWQGFHGGGAATIPLGPCNRAAAERALAALLRRFVSEAWIARRCGPATTVAALDAHDPSHASASPVE